MLDVKDVAEEVMTPLPLPGVEESPLDPGDIWLVVILACTDQSSIWYTYNDTDGTPRDDTVLKWLTGNRIAARARSRISPERSRSLNLVNNY